MFRHYRVVLRQLVINILPSYTSISNTAVGNTVRIIQPGQHDSNMNMQIFQKYSSNKFHENPFGKYSCNKFHEKSLEKYASNKFNENPFENSQVTNFMKIL
jgi:hypothetical protein